MTHAARGIETTCCICGIVLTRWVRDIATTRWDGGTMRLYCDRTVEMTHVVRDISMVK